jgi:hypothetical protein
VPARLGRVAAPRVQPVASDQEAMRGRLARQRRVHRVDAVRPDQRIRHDRQLLAVLVARDALERREHLEAFDGERLSTSREDGGPHRLGVGHGPGIARADDRQVDRRLGGRPSRSADPRAHRVDLEDRVGRERALVDAARRDGEAQRLPRHHGAEVAARCGHGAAAGARARQRADLLRRGLEVAHPQHCTA